MAGTPSLFDDLPPPEPRRDPAREARSGRRRPPPAPEPLPVEPDGPAAPARESRVEPPGPRVVSVSQLTGALRGALERFGPVAVEGEVRGVSRPGSGHVYFDLSDEDAKLRCVIWRSSLAGALRFDLRDGMQVVAHGKLDVYAPRGTYSLTVRRLEQSGIGLLLAQFEELKRDLAARGWFERKRPLPRMPRMIGVVTSRDGAALRDFLRTRSLRWPLYPVRLAHAPVQGPGAAVELARAIERLDASGVDVIVVTRGGGSLEDLWAFNELPVAAAIRGASVPVVSGVGHEVDTTLADLVADFRAHTPTDAAQTVIPDRGALSAELERLSNWLIEAMDGCLAQRTERLERAGRSRVLRDAGWIVADRERRLAELARRQQAVLERRLDRAAARAAEAHRRLQRQSPRVQLEQRTRRLERAGLALVPRAEAQLARRERALELCAARLEAYSPVRILARGYSITTRAAATGESGGPAAGETLRDAGALSVGERIETRLARGRLVSQVTDVLPLEEDRGDAGGAEGERADTGAASRARPG